MKHLADVGKIQRKIDKVEHRTKRVKTQSRENDENFWDIQREWNNTTTKRKTEKKNKEMKMNKIQRHKTKNKYQNKKKHTK